MITYTATYSPDDNKLRLYASEERLPPEIYNRVRAAGFIRAPKQGLFVAPMWTPARAGFLMDLAGDIGDEDKTLTERQEERAERFEDYSDKRQADAERAHEAVADIAKCANGQSIIVGHHSQRRAERDKERIESGMRKAVELWDTSKYWTSRAAGAIRHAKYKELPKVRAGRIKSIEADKRRKERDREKASLFLSMWRKLDDPSWLKKGGQPVTEHERALFVATRDHISHCFTLAEFPRDPPASQNEGSMGLWSALTDGIITAQQAAAIAIPVHERTIASADRWIPHYDNRLLYERAMLEAQGASDLIAPKPRPKLPPLCNYRAPEGLMVPDPYNRGELVRYPQREMTSAEYAKIYTDYKGTRIVDHSHRVRTAIIGRDHLCVFITDSKVHERPAAKTVEPPQPAFLPARGSYVQPERTKFDDLRDSLKAGVKAVSAPQLLPTPRDLATRVIRKADIRPGQRVLEPSAGTGNLLAAMGGLMFAHNPDCGALVAVEVNSGLAQQLATSFPLTDVRCADFLKCNGDLGSFDRIVMNPPFADGQDVQHVTHALPMLKPGGRLVAVMSAGVMFRGDRRTTAFRAMIEQRGGVFEPLPDDSFKESGTGVSTVLLTIESGGLPSQKGGIERGYYAQMACDTL